MLKPPFDEDRQSSIDLECCGSIRLVQNFQTEPMCQTADEYATQVLDMMNPPHHVMVRASINLALHWHKSVTEVADHNHNVVRDKLFKSLKQQTPLNLPKYFITVVGYSTHHLEGFVSNPESETIPSTPPPAERSAEDHPCGSALSLSEYLCNKKEFSDGSMS